MKPLVLAIAVIVQVASVTQAGAQRSIQLGVAGGVALPLGRTDSLYKPGPSGLVTLVLGSQDAPMGLRLDYQYDGFKGRTLGAGKIQDFHTNSISANVVVPFRIGYTKPYIIGGVGVYPMRASGSSKRENDWGENGGAGVSFPLPYTSIGGFVEARYHSVNGPGSRTSHFVPITLGVLF